jgi:hypothetical protein
MTMSLIRICALGLVAQIGVSAPAAAQSGPASRPPLMDREKEIVLALSSCPVIGEQGGGLCARRVRLCQNAG